MTSKERWLGTISNKPTDRLPFDFWSTPEVMASLHAHFAVDSDREVFARLHVDRPIIIEPDYAGLQLPPNTDIWGCRTKNVKHQTGSYDEIVFAPLAQFGSVEEIEAGYKWPAPDLYNYTSVGAQVAGKDDEPVQYTMAGVYTLYTKLRGLEQAFIDFAANHEIVEYCLDL